MSYMLAHLHNGWQVDQAILSEEDRVVVSIVPITAVSYRLIGLILSFRCLRVSLLQVIRFGHDWDPTCMKMDEVLYSIAEKVKNYAVFYLVDITAVPDFNKM